MIDLHSHILRGVDDGARSLEDSIDIARAAVADGITAMAATPHVRDDWPTRPDVMEERLAELRAALEREGVPLEVHGGGEIAIDWLGRLSDEDLRRFCLGGTQYLLVETPYYGWPGVLTDLLLSLVERGFRPVLAHPERNMEIQLRPERLLPLVDAGVLVPVTAASVDGRIGRRAQDCGRGLVWAGLGHLLASDAHHASVRAVGMAAAASAVGGGTLGHWLTVDVPAAILAGGEISPRPGQPRRGGWVKRLLRS